MLGDLACNDFAAIKTKNLVPGPLWRRPGCPLPPASALDRSVLTPPPPSPGGAPPRWNWPPNLKKHDMTNRVFMLQVSGIVNTVAWVDEIHFAPPKKPQGCKKKVVCNPYVMATVDWRNSAPPFRTPGMIRFPNVNTNQPWFQPWFQSGANGFRPATLWTPGINPWFMDEFTVVASIWTISSLLGCSAELRAWPPGLQPTNDKVHFTKGVL